jgi:hypothetical protein
MDCPNLDGLALDVNEVDVSALFTTWLRAELVLVLKSSSPPYTAVIEWDPTDKVDVENVAWPPLSVPVPSVVAPSLNVTVPVGVPLPEPDAATVAVNVTDCPNTDGL